MNQALEARALAINSRRQELQKECSDLANEADQIAEEIQELIDDNEDVEDEEEARDFDLAGHEAAYGNVMEWQEALKEAATALDL